MNFHLTTASLLCSFFIATFCTQHGVVEEVDFTQCLVHPIVTNESLIDPKPFKPYNVKVVASASLDPVRLDCDCGVHEHKENEDAKTNFPWVNGPITEKNQFPFVVALVYRTANLSATHFCGGTLLTSKLVLTATHCLERRRADKTEVWLNERNFLLSTDTDYPTLKIKVKRFIAHPEYNPLMNYNDISLIELSEPVDILKSYLRPICLPSFTDYEPTQHVSTGFTAGWGQAVFNGPKSDDLRHVEVPLITNIKCISDSEPYYKKRVTTHMICAGDLQKGGRDACRGDSGGPLWVKHKERYRLIGIVSWGDRCSEPRKPGVYTRVSKYLRWIRKMGAEIDQSQECADEIKNLTPA